MSTRQDVIDAYDLLLIEMDTNPFIDAYIKFKTKSKLRYHFLNVMNNLGTSVDDYSVTWKNSIKYVEWYNESVTADECLLSIQTIRDYLTFLEQVINEKVESTVDPQPTDNTYSIGSIWINTATDSYFILTSIVLGVATWTPSGSGGAGTGDITGSGTSGRIALWNGNKTITSDGELTYDSANDILTVENIKHTGNYKENVIVLNTNTTLGNTHSHIVLGEGNNGFIEVSGVTNHDYLNGLYEEVDLSIVNPYNLKKMYRKVGVTEPDNPEPAMWLPNNPAYSIYGWSIGNIDVRADFVEYPLGDGDNLTEEPYNVASFTGVNGGTGDIIVSLSSDPYAVSLPLITSSNVNITYNFKNITQNIINLNSFSPQKFDNGNNSTYSIGVGNQLKVVATEISTGVYTWVIFN